MMATPSNREGLHMYVIDAAWAGMEKFGVHKYGCQPQGVSSGAQTMNNLTKKGALLVAGLGGAFGLFAQLERNRRHLVSQWSRRRLWSRRRGPYRRAPLIV
jgi:hypothetical protein